MFNSKTFSTLLALVFAFSFSATAQDMMKKGDHAMMEKATVKTIALEQTPGEFTVKSLSLTPGDYQFAITNTGVDHEVGFVLAPKGKTDQANHIKEAYVTSPVKTNGTQKSNVVSLTPGEYVYFCPLNPTAQYNLTVTAPVVKLTQIPGAFTEKTLTLAAGQYQFEIANKGVDHEVGFVLAPKGKTDQANHIKEAYVTTPVKTNTTEKTNIVTLAPGEYVYFCPLNPTEQNTLIVK